MRALAGVFVLELAAVLVGFFLVGPAVDRMLTRRALEAGAKRDRLRPLVRDV